jgi:hypothetical protein
MKPKHLPGRLLSRCVIEPADSSVVRKPPRRKKITTQVQRGCLLGTHILVGPEPTTDRKPPAPLALFVFFLGTVLEGVTDGNGFLHFLWFLTGRSCGYLFGRTPQPPLVSEGLGALTRLLGWLNSVAVFPIRHYALRC